MTMSRRRRRRVSAGLRCCSMRAGTRLSRCDGRPKEGTNLKVAWKSPGLRDKLSAQWHHQHPNDLAPFRSRHLKLSIPSQDVPILVLGPSGRGLCWERFATMQ